MFHGNLQFEWSSSVFLFNSPSQGLAEVSIPGFLDPWIPDPEIQSRDSKFVKVTITILILVYVFLTQWAKVWILCLKMSIGIAIGNYGHKLRFSIWLKMFHIVCSIIGNNFLMGQLLAGHFFWPVEGNQFTESCCACVKETGERSEWEGPFVKGFSLPLSFPWYRNGNSFFVFVKRRLNQVISPLLTH
jgi:hypothetical protein